MPTTKTKPAATPANLRIIALGTFRRHMNSEPQSKIQKTLATVPDFFPETIDQTLSHATSVFLLNSVQEGLEVVDSVTLNLTRIQ